VSSTYRILCLNHDPAIVIDRDWSSPNDAMAAATDPGHAGLDDHLRCDLLVGRWSGGLCEIGCPPSIGPEAKCSSHHRNEHWVDLDWLRLLAAALDSSEPAVTAAVKELTSPYHCWRRERVQRLRSVL